MKLKIIFAAMVALTLVEVSHQQEVDMSSSGNLTGYSDEYFKVLSTLEEDPDDLAYPGFVKFGTYRGTNAVGKSYDKFFWFPTHFRATWVQAKFICKSYGLKMMSLDSQAELNYFMNLFTQKLPLFDDFTHLGALTTVSLSKTDWYWVATGKKLNFPMNWYPGEPNNLGADEKCLAVHLNTYFYDIKCYEIWYRKFLCQSVIEV